MNSRQARRERREAERKAKKLTQKKSRMAENHPLAAAERQTTRIDPGALELTPIGFASQRRLDANRANAQLSTGPTTSRGKLASSRNSTKHGLASGTLIIPGEDPAAFEALLNDFLEEHQPATPTEDLLIKEMAQSFWLTQRAIRLQNDCFTLEGVDQKQLALLLRYQTTHSGRFHKALNALLKLRKIGFVSQRSPKTGETVGFASHSDPEMHPTDQFVPRNAPHNTEKRVLQHPA